MGSYASLDVDDLPLAWFKTNVAPEAMALFRPGDLRITKERDEDGEEWRRARLAISGGVAIDRLNAMGFTHSRALHDFEDARAWIVDEDAYLLPTDEDKAVLARMTPDEWLTALAQLRGRRDRNDVTGLSPVAKCFHEISSVHHRFEELPFPDPRSGVRLALDHGSATADISCDISELVGAWRMNVDDPEEIASLFEPIEDKLLILTEGATDSSVIRSALAVVYPHLVDYIAFLDFESSNYGGGAPSLMTLGESGRRRGEWSPTDMTLGAIASALASASVAPSRFRDEWFAREQSRRSEPPTSEGAVVIVTEGLPHLIAAVHVLDRRINQARNCLDDERTREVGKLWDWLYELATGRDPGIDLIRVRGAEFALQLLGYLLSIQPWPPDQWKAVYRALEAHRRRVSTRNREDDFLPARSSADFIWIGLYGCSSWRAVSSEPAIGAREFFFELIECSRALFLLDGGIDLVGRASREALTTCFAAVPRVLGAPVIEDVVTMLEPIANDPGLLRDIFSVLRANGVDDATMAGICARLNIDEATAIAFGNRILPPPSQS